uniref:Uncharacterized protein n=1 Tax=Oryza punctata TaxID=4537 RepID=A0A0E0LLF4_ORYPU
MDLGAGLLVAAAIGKVATNEAEELLRDVETDQVNASISNATQDSSGDRGHAPSQVIDWLRSDNDNLLRMESTIGRLASICAEGGSIIGMPNMEESHLVDLNKEITSFPSDISRNETKPSTDGPLIIGRDEEITVLLDMVLGDARYATSSLEGREEADELQISQKGWVVKTLESLDLLGASHVDSEEVTYQNEMWSKVQYTRITHGDTVPELQNPTVIPIVGIGGVGKTALAQLIFNERRVREHFGDKSAYAWVYVTDNTSEEKMIEHIIAAFIGQEGYLAYNEAYHPDLGNIIQGRRFLLVLDDVWSDIHEIWSNIRRILSKGAPGSVVLVTTQLYEVASFMGTTCPVVLNPLQSGDLWKLIKHYAFTDPCNYQYAENLEQIGRNIEAKLHGLPLAAKIIGSLLRGNVDEDHWNRLLKSWWWKSSHNILCGNIISSIGISYCSLPGYLRQCFLFLSNFPRNYVFKKHKLSQMWIASGFIQPNNVTSSRRLEDITGEWFDELINWAFLGPSGCKTGFVMHDLVRDFAIALSSNGFRGMNTVNDSSQILHYLSIEMGGVNVQLSDFEIKHLEPLMMFADFGQSSSSDACNSMHKVEDRSKSLCILDYSSSWWCEPRAYPVALGLDIAYPICPPNAISRLKYLRYLDLSFTGIDMLPDSVCSLCHLLVLGLEGCVFDELPAKMNCLINLRHLHASSYTTNKINGIGKLTKLQELHEFHIKSQEGHRITELSDMNDLRGSLCIANLEMVTDPAEALKANIAEKDYVTALELSWSYTFPEPPIPCWSPPRYPQELEILSQHDLCKSILGCLTPPRYLQELKLYGYSGFEFPDWVEQLKHVRVVEISSCENLNVLPPLGQLERLQKLKLHGLSSIKDINSDFCGTSRVVFPSLEELSFGYMENWESWTYAGSSDFIPNLQKLQILRPCDKLRKLPFESLGSAMKEIIIEYCDPFDDTFSRYLQGLYGLTRLEVCGNWPYQSGKLIILPCKQLMSLEYLHITSFLDVRIKGGLWYIRNLKDLAISHCSAVVTDADEESAHEDKQAPTQIDRAMHSLTHLSLGGDPTHMVDLEIVIPQAPSLRHLCLDVRRHTSITEKWLQHLTSLQELDLCCYDILPSILSSLSSLKRFTLICCYSIHSIPPNSLPGNLKELQIENCSLELEARCQNPTGDAWRWWPPEYTIKLWRDEKIDEWKQRKMEYGQRKLIKMQRKKEEEGSLMNEREELLKSSKEESLGEAFNEDEHEEEETNEEEPLVEELNEDDYEEEESWGDELEDEKPLGEWLQLSEGEKWPEHKWGVRSWVQRKLEEALDSSKDDPSSLMKEREEWLKEEEHKIRSEALGKDWPNISYIPYILMDGMIIQNLYT